MVPRRWPRLVRRWLVAVAAGFVGVAGVEIGMRMALGPPAVHFLTRPGRDVQTDFDVTYGVNGDGLRVTCPPAGTPERRIVVIGDSFAFGGGVGDGEDFAARISCRMPQAQVLNLGSSGQDFLYYDLALHSLVADDVDDIVLLIYENDLPSADWEGLLWGIKRTLYRSSHMALVLRRAKRQIAQQLHRTDIESFTVGGKFNNPKVVALSNPAFFEDLARPSADRLDVFERTFRRFVEGTRQVSPKARLFVAFAPEASTVSKGHRDFYRSLADVPLPLFGEPSILYRRAQAICARLPGCSFIDLYPVLARNGDTTYFPHDFHWNARGHELVADVVFRALDGLTE